MLPKSYVVFKWTVYALASLLLFALQSLLLSHIRVMGVTPFLYPILPAAAAMYEGSRRGPLFALALGVVCDLLLPGPFQGFFAISFTLIALFSAMMAENFIEPGFLCALIVSAGGLLLTGGEYLGLMGRIALQETLLTLPAAVVVFPLYRVIHRRCAVDY